jgi:hypothetical protein
VLLVIDNYDSFTFNLVQYFGQLGVEQKVFRNDEITPAQALALNPDRVLLSPGPCSPKEAGVTLDIIKAFAGVKPIRRLPRAPVHGHYLAARLCARRPCTQDLADLHKNTDVFRGCRIFQRDPLPLAARRARVVPLPRESPPRRPRGDHGPAPPRVRSGRAVPSEFDRHEDA